MPKRLWTITAENNEGTEIYLSDLFETEPSRAGLVRGLCTIAMEKAGGSIPDGREGATAEERLAELGYRITSITDTDPAR
jgi:hypothetical protein